MTRFRVLYPDSFLKLLSIGFVLTMLPLLFAFANAALSLDSLATQSQQTVHRAVEATRASRELNAQLTVIERSTRQYLVLGDPALLENFRNAHRKFAATLADLSQLPLDRDVRAKLKELERRENALFDTIAGNTPATDMQAVVTEFVHLSELAAGILDANNALIDRESSLLAASAERAQHMLLWQTLPLIPIALVVAVAITVLLTRPIRHMDIAIRRLGMGDYTDMIAIDGPADLRTLGQRLEWLRVQLRELEEQKERFLRHVSHELKTPLTSIREGSELLSEEVGGKLTPQQREIAGILQENGLRLQKMIENLLNFSAVQSKTQPLRPESIAMRPLIEQAIAAYSLSLESRALALSTDLADITLEGDRAQLLTLMDNLVSNAVKYTPRNGNITIRLAAEQGGAVIEVQDSGPGIRASDRERIFEPFYRGNGPLENHAGGSGLGLAIASEYAAAHGGKIELAATDSGACFRVTLPLHQRKAT